MALSDWRLRLRSLLFRERVEQEMEAELRFHLERDAEARRARGAAPAEAERQARIAMGGLDPAREACRDARGVAALEALGRDVRHALRRLARRPGVLAVVVLSLAVGIGANVTVFSWIRGVVLNPIPGAASQGQLVSLETLLPSGARLDTSYMDYRDFRQAQCFSGLLAFREWQIGLSQGPGLGQRAGAQLVSGERVSGNFFSVLGVHPRLGRFFTSREAAAGAQVAVISSQLWQRRFHHSAAVLGQVLQLNHQAYTVIGVTPAAFQGAMGGVSDSVFILLRAPLGWAGELSDRNWRDIKQIGRLRPGVTLGQARAQVQTIAATLARRYPKSNTGIGAALVPMAKANYGAQQVLAAPLLALGATAILLLLVVWFNIINVVLSLALEQRRETAIRLALGVGRGGLLRQFLAEGLLLGSGGAALGLIVAHWGSGAMRLLLPPTNMPIRLAAGLGWPAWAVAAACAVATALICGLAPSWQESQRAARRDPGAALHEGARTAGPSRRAGRVSRGLVLAEWALALMAVAAAGLLAQSFHNARRMDIGFNPQGVLLTGLYPSTAGFTTAQSLAFYRQLRRDVAQIPGVSGVAIAQDVPLGFEGGSWRQVSPEGYVPARGEDMKVYRDPVSPNYFSVLQIPILAGRGFNAQDTATSYPVAVVNQTFAQRYYHGQDPVGLKFGLGGENVTIVGEAANSKYHSLTESPGPYFYLPLPQNYDGSGVALEVRARPGATAVAQAVVSRLRGADANIPIYGPVPMTQFIGAAYFGQKVAAAFMALLALLALALAAMGLYAISARAVAQRVREIGVRVALGARPADISRMFLGQGLRLAIWGGVAGVVGAFFMDRLLASLLIGVGPGDPRVWLEVAAVLAGVGVLAAWWPARRAARVDPQVAMRCE